MSTALIEPPKAIAGGPSVRTRPAKALVKTCRDAQGIYVERAIVHILDHRNAIAPVLSDAELVFEPDPRLRRYFEDQIVNVLGDSELTDSRFLDDGHPVARSCWSILADPAAFDTESRLLAQKLWDATGSNQSIAPGSLIVCQFRAGNHDADLLALLKIDPTDVLLQSVTRPNGHINVTLTVAENALPTARERLQKGALVAPQGYAERCDLLLLDRMAPKAPADFFTRKFLNVRPTPSPRERTRRFYEAAVEAQNELAGKLTPEQDDYLDGEIEHAARGRQLDALKWAKGLDLPDPAKEVLTRRMKDDLDVAQFELDPGYAAEKLVKTRRYRGDYGIVIEFDRKFQDFHLGESYPRADGVPITPVTLQVPNLRKVK